MKKHVDLNLLIDSAEMLSSDFGNTQFTHIYQNKTTPIHYKIIKTLAKGGYGEVFIIKRNGKIYAMKKVSKNTVLKNHNSTFFMNEKEIMTECNSEWLVKSYECIQDETDLYYVMDFIPGGDLMGYLSKKDSIEEEEIRFYASELVVAVDSMHKLGWIHRDLKPDNILIDSSGHIKLGDFGSCIKMTNGRAESSMTVGTPDYVSPDLLVSIGETVTYGCEIDLWTVGVIIYEMFYGTTPFYSESLKETYKKISTISYTIDGKISTELKDLIEHLLCKKEDRLSTEQIKAHSFFKGVDWENLKNSVPPYIPELKGEEDISNFVDTEFVPEISKLKCGFKDFIGFTSDPSHCKFIIENYLNLSDEQIESILKKRIASEQEFPTKLLSSLRLSNYDEDKCVKKTDNPVIENITSESNLVTLSSHDQKSVEENKASLNKMIAEMEDSWKNESNRISAEIEENKKSLEALNQDIVRLQNERNLRESELNVYNNSVKQAIDALMRTKEDNEILQATIKKAREELENIKNDISDKIALKTSIEDRISTGCNIQLTEDLRDIKKSISRAEFEKNLEAIKKIAYWLYKENLSIRNELKIQTESVSDSKNSDDLKKQLRIKKTEIREYQQKIENEMILRSRLEDEIKVLKATIKNSALSSKKSLSMKVSNLNNSKDVEIVVDKNVFRLGDREAPLTGIYIKELDNNELHHLSYKRRALCLKVYFLKEIAKSSTSGTRRSLKALEADREKEIKILAGLESLLPMLSGKTKDEAEEQRKGSIKKLGQLHDEIEKAKKSTITEYEVDDNEKVYEFNNHLFYEKTVAKGTLCDHCNEVLYGLVNQAFCCKDCLLVVHKSCYVLGNISCELNRAMKEGSNVNILCKTVEDKQKILQLNSV